uniref:HTH_48 domain-containing protein n=1 Tax=Steinernema glaseri TaxID=37863 RepID=A0A1I7YMS8_9BILA
MQGVLRRRGRGLTLEEEEQLHDVVFGDRPTHGEVSENAKWTFERRRSRKRRASEGFHIHHHAQDGSPFKGHRFAAKEVHKESANYPLP